MIWLVASSSWPSTICELDQVAGLTWSGNPAHLRSVAAALDRAAQPLGESLVMRAPGGAVIAKDAGRLHRRGRHGRLLAAGHHGPAAGPRHCDDAHRRSP